MRSPGAWGSRPGGTYPALVRSIQEAVQERNELGSVRSLLILDDAHEMRPDVLGFLKDQARSMLQVGRILSTQVEAYLELTEMDRPKRRS